MTVVIPSLDHKTTIRRLLLSQCIVGMVVMLVVSMLFSFMFAASLCYGVMIVMLSSIIIQKNLHKATDIDPDRGKKLLLKSAGMRFFMVLALLFLAYGIGLHLLWVAAGFFIAQLVAYIYFLCVFYRQQK